MLQNEKHSLKDTTPSDIVLDILTFVDPIRVDRDFYPEQ